MKILKLIKTGLVIGLLIIGSCGISYGGCALLDDDLVREIEKRYKPEFTCCMKVIFNYYNEHGMPEEDRQRLMIAIQDLVLPDDLLQRLVVAPHGFEETVKRFENLNVEKLNTLKNFIDNVTFEDLIKRIGKNIKDEYLSRCNELEVLDYKRALDRLIEIFFLMDEECARALIAS